MEFILASQVFAMLRMTVKMKRIDLNFTFLFPFEGVRR